MKRIHESLQRVFEQHRIVFWYDATGEWAEAFESFSDAGVTNLQVANNEFGTKVRIVRDPNPRARFLVYVPTARPLDSNNWLLDLLFQGYEYKADKASLALEEVGLPRDFLELAQEHIAFFRSEKRNQELKERLTKDDQPRDVRLKMMAVLSNTAVEADALLLHFLSESAGEFATDPVPKSFASFALVEPFWREVARMFGYQADAPSLLDFAYTLFRGANPLDKAVPLHPHSKVFLKRWQDSQAHSESFCEWARYLEEQLKVRETLLNLDEPAKLSDCDAFEIFEKYTLHRLCEAFAQGRPAAELRAVMQQRRTSFWQREHQDGYQALEQAVELRELLGGAELAMDSITTGVRRYTDSWWRIDQAYRRCVLHLRRYGNEQVMRPIEEWVEKNYLNNFLLPLADRWSDQVRQLATWEGPGLVTQRRFFAHYVQPFQLKKQKVFVIISDALRYEAAVEFAQRLQTNNRWTAEVEAMFGALPTYTQLGMAALLPGRQLAVDAATAQVTVDGRSATGTANRAEILRVLSGVAATAIQAKDFLELNSKTDGRALMREHEIIYIFHDHIDDVGDKLKTEVKALAAVEQAFDELEQIIKKVAAINGSNMLLTADHGFLFQQTEVADDDMTPLPTEMKWTCRNRRFALGKGRTSDAQVKTFDAAELGLTGEWTAAFPLGLGRFPLQGSGKRFVHGGFSLQEVVVPVVRIHKKRVDDIEQVEVEFTHVPQKITTGQVAITLYQDQPVVDKVLPRTLRVGLFAKDNTELSEIKTVTFDSSDAEARNRETRLLLTLAGTADAYNNREVELRLLETKPGTNQTVVYKAYGLKLQKPFASDFDEF